MLELLGGIAIALVSGVIGYFARSREFHRDERLKAYGGFSQAFLDAAHSGASLLAVHVQLGDSMFGDQAHRVQGAWDDWRKASNAFEAAAVRLQLIGSRRARKASELLERFLEENVRAVPPFRRGARPSDWGDAARVGPAHVERVATLLAGDFAGKARSILPWRKTRVER